MKKSDFVKAVNDEMKPQFNSIGMDKAYWCGMHAILETIRVSADYDEIKSDKVTLTYHEVCALAEQLYDLVLTDLSV